MASQTRRFPEPPRPQPTGRYLVLFKADADPSSITSTVERSTGAKMIDSLEIGATGEAMENALSPGNAVMIDRFKVAVIAPGEDAGVRMAALQAAESVRQMRPEFFMFAIDELRQRYANWVREGLQLLAEGATSVFQSAQAAVSEVSLLEAPFADTDEFTWGLAAVGAHRSAYTGQGIRVAVLDTGLDLGHPDFVGRPIVSQSFVAGEDVQDVQGHGTHTAGTIAGPKRSNIGRRYGVAPEVELYVGKVLNNGGSGKEADILNGMNWAIEQQCVAISMSLGRPTSPEENPDPMYEEAGAAALREGSLIIAAAGNESARDFGFIAPVGAPANSPSIMATAAVDPNLRVAPFSCGGLTPSGGEVNISGPGVSVYSSFPRPRLSRVLQGTSMACPHIAGLAALWAQSDASLRGRRLWDAIERSARELGSFRDYGRGLGQVRLQRPEGVASSTAAAPIAFSLPPFGPSPLAQAGAEKDAAIADVRNAIIDLDVVINATADDAQRTALRRNSEELAERLTELVALRLSDILDGPKTQAALAKLRGITGDLKTEAAKMKQTADALSTAAKVISQVTRLIGFLGGAFA